MLCVIFMLLQNGIHINNIKIPNIKIKTLYIKWNEKLHISVKEINIVKKTEKNSKINYKQINDIFKKIVLFDNWFEKVNIDKITINELEASFSYKADRKGYLDISSPNFLLNSTLYFESNLFSINIKNFTDYKRKIKTHGTIILDTNILEITTDLNLNINNDMDFNLLVNANQKKLFYKIDSNKNIKSIKHLVDMINLDKSISYWIIDAIDMDKLSINSAYGWLDYNHIDEAYKNFYAHATIKKLNYTYDKKLDAIHTKTTDLEFKDANLYIYPKKAFTYGFYLDKSWIKIDFTKNKELVALNLKFNAMLNKDILYLLNRYKIKLPFLQNSGKVKTDLKILIGLRDINVSAKGHFYTKKANFTYLGLDLDIFNANIYIDNYDVKIDKMLAKYEDIATALVDVKLDTKTNEGYIDLSFSDISLKKQYIKLSKPLKAKYKISPKQDLIKIDSSSWDVINKKVTIDSMDIPFSLKNLEATIPSTPVNMQNVALANVDGKILLAQRKVFLTIDLEKFIYDGIKLVQKDKKFKLSFDENELNIEHGDIIIEDSVDTSFSAYYNFNKNSGHINLRDLKIKNKTFGDIFKKEEIIKLDIIFNDKQLYVNSKEFDTNFILSNKSWKLKIKNLSHLSKQSTLLQKYFIDNGDINLYKNINSKKIIFNAKTLYPYKIIVVDNKPVQNYKIQGFYKTDTNSTEIDINKKLHVTVKDDINITTKNIGIEINEVLSFLSKNNNKKEDGESMNIIFNAIDSYIYISEHRHVISDQINLKYSNNIATAYLIYKKGDASFVFENNTFNLYGNNFNDEFMEKLFSASKFEGGRLNFAISGTPKEYNGLIDVKDTVILEYTILNNILAFVNTIPSLITFSLPGYHRDGLSIDNAYINFNTKDGKQFNIKSSSLNSKEIKIAGKGKANFATNNINMKLNLITDLGSAISKIPVVGYIFLGNNSISSSLEVVGKLNDPKIKTRLAEDIVVAPLNIIKRTLLLPLYLFLDDNKTN